MYSVIHEGKILDHHFKRHTANSYTFYVGDIYVGQIHKLRKSWSIISKTVNDLSPIHGLRTRIDGAILLLKMEGIIKKDRGY